MNCDTNYQFSKKKVEKTLPSIGTPQKNRKCIKEGIWYQTPLTQKYYAFQQGAGWDECLRRCLQVWFWCNNTSVENNPNRIFKGKIGNKSLAIPVSSSSSSNGPTTTTSITRGLYPGGSVVWCVLLCHVRMVFWFLVCYAATQLTTQLPQRRMQAVRSNKVARKRLTESNGTPAIDLRQRVIDWFWLSIFPTNLVRGLSNKEMSSLRRLRMTHETHMSYVNHIWLLILFVVFRIRRWAP